MDLVTRAFTSLLHASPARYLRFPISTCREQAGRVCKLFRLLSRLQIPRCTCVAPSDRRRIRAWERRRRVETSPSSGDTDESQFHSCGGIGLHVRGGELVSTATSDESEGWRKHESPEVIKWEVNKDAEGLVMMTHTCP